MGKFELRNINTKDRNKFSCVGTLSHFFKMTLRTLLLGTWFNTDFYK